ncbi:MAG TPA: hypothetical protein VN855_00285, partial [Candidatus Acidoferrum sp.]|nr:hypothetical protein [Candidatus Acidoferrum sp.]
MNKYPLDHQGIQNIFNDFLKHDLAQREIMNKLVGYLREAMAWVDDDINETWYQEAETLVQELYKRKMDFDNFRFDQQNGHKQEEISPYSTVPQLIPGEHLGPAHEQAFNDAEEGFGPPMTTEELASYFGESLPKKPKKTKAVHKMDLQEIQEWEKQQDNSTDIYKIAARVKNLARSNDATLTQVGESLCNVYVHVLKSF